MKYLKLWFCFVVFPFFLQAQDFHTGASSTASAGCRMYDKDVWAIYQNPASLSGISSFSVGVDAGFAFLPELSKSAISIAYPLKNQTFALAYDAFGFALFRQHHLSMAMSKYMGTKCSVAFKVDYEHVYLAEGYEPLDKLAVAFAINYQLNANVIFSTYLFNPFNIRLPSSQDEYFPSMIRMGISYVFNTQFIISSLLEYELLQKVNMAVSGVYTLFDCFFLRFGMAFYPAECAFGVGIALNKSWMVDVAAAYQSRIGYMPQFSLTWKKGTVTL